jgi:transposase
MSQTKKQYSPQFKAKVALEAVEGVKTIAELSSEYSIHPSVLNKWKRKLIEESVKLFESDSSKSAQTQDNQAEINELYRQIGKLKVERDFLADRSARLGLPTAKPW